ncbi:MAG: DUF2948 family protein [Rhodobacteraceae bacterium]|jgi:hypothetical protein|nr:DUF2948 family protein [Paracoccaceae bacterium]MCF8514584.1 DUF2948 family protein [Paracoccaceae bacterium]MCF8518875.1 DUF2948 family protein [Paracoccaceae bacterium]
MADARFEDGEEGPLRLIARQAEDVLVLSSLLQDAVFPMSEMRYDRKARRFALLVNRFRWEDRAAAEVAKRPFERVRSLLVIEDVMAVRTSGIDRADKDLILSLLSLGFVAGEDGTGVLTLILAGDGAIALDLEALELHLDDVTRPYIAPSRKQPSHND